MERSTRPVLDVGWVPGGACTLPTAEQPLRVAEFDDLFRRALRETTRPTATEAVLLLDGAAEAEVRGLAERETGCCSFFSMPVTRVDADRVELRIGVPTQRVDVLDALLARIAATQSR